MAQGDSDETQLFIKDGEDEVVSPTSPSMRTRKFVAETLRTFAAEIETGDSKLLGYVLEAGVVQETTEDFYVNHQTGFLELNLKLDREPKNP